MSVRFNLVAAVLFMLTPATAHSQQSGGPIDIQTFRPAMDSRGYITLNSSRPLGHLDYSVGLVVNYAYNVLNMYSPTSNGGYYGSVWCQPGTAAGTCSVGADGHVPIRYDIENMVSGQFQLALGLFKYFDVGLSMPVTIWTGDTDPDADLETGDTGDISGQNAGDMGLHIKGRILNTSKHPVGLGVVLSTYFPTGSPELFMGSGGITIHPSIILDKAFMRGRINMAINLGARIVAGSLRGDAENWKDSRECYEWDDISGAVSHGIIRECGTGEEIKRSALLTYGIGGTFAVVPGKFSLVAEIVGQTGFDAFFDAGAFHSAHELLVGFKFYLSRNSYFTLGVGRGLRGQSDNHQYGSPDIRVFGGIIYDPSFGDRDGDGHNDDVDKCPDTPEDFDEFEDSDGCPEPDNDNDGVLDEDDKCPNDPVAKDGKINKDGCPEAEILDRDGDGIPDSVDSCPNAAEDMDDFEDEDGCPDTDSDNDKVVTGHVRPVNTASTKSSAENKAPYNRKATRLENTKGPVEETKGITRSEKKNGSLGNKQILAVFDIEDKGGSGLSKELMSRLSNYLAMRLAASGKYEVVPREQLKQQLANQKVKSYKQCYDQSCQIEIGRELAAQKSLTTAIIRLGSNCTVTAVLYDLKKATSEGGASVDGECTENEIAKSVIKLVNKLTDRR